MLHSNLSTRPFYNDRIVRMGIGAVALIVIGLTVFNAVRGWQLRSANRELGVVVQQSEREASALVLEAQAIRESINNERLSLVQAEARVANELIDRRAFSWTELLNQFQITLPGDVRIAAVQPQIDADGRLLLAVTVVSKRIEDLDEFIEALEKTGAFSGVLSRSDSAEDDRTLLSILQGYYRRSEAAAQAPSAVPVAPASKPEKDAP